MFVLLQRRKYDIKAFMVSVGLINSCVFTTERVLCISKKYNQKYENVTTNSITFQVNYINII